MEEESDLVLWKQVHRNIETDQVPESDLPPVPEDDDLNTTVIEVISDRCICCELCSSLPYSRTTTAHLKIFTACAPFLKCCDRVMAALKLATHLLDAEGKKVLIGITQEKKEDMASVWTVH